LGILEACVAISILGPAVGLAFMKCNLCGHAWHAPVRYCPRCGSPVLGKRRFYWELFLLIVAGLFVWWLTRSHN